MNGRTLKIAALCIAVSAVTFFVTNRLGGVQGQQGAQVQQMTPGTGFAAVPGMKGGQDVFGPYDPVQNWPRPLAESLPNHDGVDMVAGDRRVRREPGPRDRRAEGRAARAADGAWPRHHLAAADRARASSSPSAAACRCARPPAPRRAHGRAAADGSDGRAGVDWRWEHVIAVFDRNGKMIEDWSQWDKIWGRPHDVEISPYDPEKHIWIVDADNHFVAKFTNDGKKQVLLLGTPGVPGNDDTHFAPADVHGLHGRQHLVSGRRLRQHPRHQVRHERQEAAGVGDEGDAAERAASRLLQQRARHRRQSEDAAACT